MFYQLLRVWDAGKSCCYMMLTVRTRAVNIQSAGVTHAMILCCTHCDLAREQLEERTARDGAPIFNGLSVDGGMERAAGNVPLIMQDEQRDTSSTHRSLFLRRAILGIHAQCG